MIASVAWLAGRTKDCVDARDEGGIVNDAFEFLRIVLRKFAGAHPTRCGDFDAREAIAVEGSVEVAVSFDDVGGARLEADLGELRLHQEIAEAHIDLGAIEAAVRERHTRLPAKDGDSLDVDAQRIAHGRGFGDAGCAENVHEQCVGAHGRVELAPAPGWVDLRLGQRPRGLGVDFVKAAHPVRVCGDGRVGSVEEVSVEAVFRLVDKHRRTSIAFNMLAPASVAAVAQGELLPNLCCIRAWRNHVSTGTSATPATPKTRR